jgi:hypothetical protein
MNAHILELKPPLTNVQLELLKAFSLNLPEADLKKIQNFITHLLLEHAHDAADAAWEERGYTNETMEEWLHSHDRTPYTRSASALAEVVAESSAKEMIGA